MRTYTKRERGTKNTDRHRDRDKQKLTQTDTKRNTETQTHAGHLDREGDRTG